MSTTVATMPESVISLRNGKEGPIPLLAAGRWQTTSEIIAVHSPYDSSLVAEVSAAGEAEMEASLAAADATFAETRALPAHRRSAILRHIADRMEALQAEFADILQTEAGKSRSDAELEAMRAVQTMRVAVDEANRIGGEVVPMDRVPAGEKRFAVNRRFPLGPVLGITPFNYPLNLVCHKLGPAIAVGNPFILKPASVTPLVALRLAEIVLETDWPVGALSVLPCRGSAADYLVKDERIKMITFTGSTEVGWQLKANSGKKRVALELGGNAGIVIHSDADLALAVERCAFGGFTNAGQNCISVQRLLVHRDVYDAFVDRLVARVKQLKVGDPSDPEVIVGPMIEEKAAERAESWLREAEAQGAAVHCGGRRRGTILEPAVVTDVTPEMKITCQEVFAPIVTVAPYDDFEEALEMVNSSNYGLQAGVFTNDVKRIFQAYERIEAGGIMINEVSTFRVDHMPYGGMKDSGIGREGVRYAMEEMTETKIMVINLA